MISGLSAETTVDTILANGVISSCRARSSFVTTGDTAPSLGGQQVAAVTVSELVRTGFILSMPSR